VARPGKAFHHAYPEKPWTQIVAMRNVLIHKHSGDRPGSGLGDVEGNEAMARALVKAWFVDFEPVCYVRAEAAENDDESFEEKIKRLGHNCVRNRRKPLYLTPPSPPTSRSRAMAGIFVALNCDKRSV
jgi:hypothetical protein